MGCYWGAALTLKLPFMPINLREKLIHILRAAQGLDRENMLLERTDIFIVNHFGSAGIDPSVAGELETIQIGPHRQ